MLAFPVHIIEKPKEKDAKPVYPPGNILYLVGSNGVFQRTVNPFYAITKKLTTIPGLANIEADVSLRVPKLPYHFIREAAAFFAAVYKEQQSEAIVLLYCHPDYGWHMDAPTQVAAQNSLHVDYDMKDQPSQVKGYVISQMVEVMENGAVVQKAVTRVSKEPKLEAGETVASEFFYELFGTIHSHAAAGAFHSGTDDKDEKHFNGLHITIGNVNLAAQTYSCRWVLEGDFYKADMHQVAEDPPEGFFDERWLKRVTKRTYSYTPAGSAAGSHGGMSSPHDDYWRRDHRSIVPSGATGTPMDSQMGDWWPEGVYGMEGGGAPRGGTFQRNGEAAEVAERAGVIILPDGQRKRTGMEPGTPEKETRLRIMTWFMSFRDTPKHQRSYFEKLDKEWRDRLIQDLVLYHPLEAAAFLRGVDVVSQSDTKSGSDAFSKNDAAKTESTISPNQSGSEKYANPTVSLLPAPAEIAAQTPGPTTKGPTEQDYLDGAFGD